jgi:hypothetical protein
VYPVSLKASDKNARECYFNKFAGNFAKCLTKTLQTTPSFSRFNEAIRALTFVYDSHPTSRAVLSLLAHCYFYSQVGLSHLDKYHALPQGPSTLRPFLAQSRWIRFSVRDCADFYRADVAAQSQTGKRTQKTPV